MAIMTLTEGTESSSCIAKENKLYRADLFVLLNTFHDNAPSSSLRFSCMLSALLLDL